MASYRVRDTPVNLPLLLLSYWKKEGDDFRVRVVAKASSTIYNLRILSKVKKVFFQNSVNENFLLGKIRRLSIWSTSFYWRWPFDVYFRWDQGWKRENYLSSSKKLSVSIKPQKSIDRNQRTRLAQNFGNAFQQIFKVFIAFRCSISYRWSFIFIGWMSGWFIIQDFLSSTTGQNWRLYFWTNLLTFYPFFYTFKDSSIKIFNEHSTLKYFWREPFAAFHLMLRAFRSPTFNL